MLSTPETSVHVRDNREISPLEREEGYRGNDVEKRWVLGREWKTLWDTPTTDLGAESEPVVRQTHKHTNKQTDGGDYNTLRSLARSVNKNIIFWLTASE